MTSSAKKKKTKKRRLVNITASLDYELAHRIDDEVYTKKYRSRSHFIERACLLLLEKV